MDTYIIEQFWKNVVKTDTCWLWTGATKSDNKSLILERRGKYWNPKYISLFIAGKNYSKAQRLMSSCNNNLCVNPDHIIPVTDENRFWSKVNKTPNCWLWQAGSRNPNRGYGVFHIYKNGKPTTLGAHRYSYELAYGAIPENMYICHHCDNPPCVRPDHLFLGTAQENVYDRDHKGRHPTAKVTEQQVREIRSLCNIQEVADQYGIATATVYEIMRGKTWSRIK